VGLRNRKLKVKLFLPTPWRHMVGGRGILHPFINSALGGGDRAEEDRKKDSNGEYCTIRHS